jgi:hypothetical protein
MSLFVIFSHTHVLILVSLSLTFALFHERSLPIVESHKSPTFQMFMLCNSYVLLT